MLHVLRVEENLERQAVKIVDSDIERRGVAKLEFIRGPGEAFRARSRRGRWRFFKHNFDLNVFLLHVLLLYRRRLFHGENAPGGGVRPESCAAFQTQAVSLEIDTLKAFSRNALGKVNGLAYTGVTPLLGDLLDVQVGDDWQVIYRLEVVRKWLQSVPSLPLCHGVVHDLVGLV